MYVGGIQIFPILRAEVPRFCQSSEAWGECGGAQILLMKIEEPQPPLPPTVMFSEWSLIINCVLNCRMVQTWAESLIIPVCFITWKWLLPTEAAQAVHWRCNSRAYPGMSADCWCARICPTIVTLIHKLYRNWHGYNMRLMLLLNWTNDCTVITFMVCLPLSEGYCHYMRHPSDCLFV